MSVPDNRPDPVVPALHLTATSREMLAGRIVALHDEIRAHFPAIVRLAVALYDAERDEIKTFLCSPASTSPLLHYATRLATASWLDTLRRERRSRVIDALDAVDLGGNTHSRRIQQAGFKSSYTVPMFDGERFLGFVFFNADAPAAFPPRTTAQLDLFVRIISLMVESTLRTAATLTGSVFLLKEIARFRDDETASHLSRMASYTGMIARALASQLRRDDEWVEQVQLFAPLHDVGKLTTPDAILMKPGALTDTELGVMRQHPVQGARILEALVERLDLGHTPYIETLLDIARYHHESWDGSGYPDHLHGADIPVEARIVKVADVFDALTTERCYKPAWPVEEALAYLEQGRGTLFDAECVDLFAEQVPEITTVMARFRQGSTDFT